MDLFGKKRQILEKAIETQRGQLAQGSIREMDLQRKIRDMDQLIFSMSQCTSWEEMRPIFAKLKTFTDARMIDESNRIKTLLIPEMQKAYRIDPTEESVRIQENMKRIR